MRPAFGLHWKHPCVYTPFNASGRNFGQLFGSMLNDYTHFHFFKGWPKFLPALWSNHHSYTYTGLLFAGVAEISASISSFCAYQQLFSHPTHSSWFQGFHKTDLYTTSERTAKIRFIEQQTKLPPKDIRVFPIFIDVAKISASFSKNIKTHGLIHQTGPSWPKSRPGPSKLEITSQKWIPLRFFGSWPKLRLAFPLVPLETCMCISTF